MGRHDEDRLVTVPEHAFRRAAKKEIRNSIVPVRGKGDKRAVVFVSELVDAFCRLAAHHVVLNVSAWEFRRRNKCIKLVPQIPEAGLIRMHVTDTSVLAWLTRRDMQDVHLCLEWPGEHDAGPNASQ
jgi:hypothetical protein